MTCHCVCVCVTEYIQWNFANVSSPSFFLMWPGSRNVEVKFSSMLKVPASQKRRRNDSICPEHQKDILLERAICTKYVTPLSLSLFLSLPPSLSLSLPLPFPLPPSLSLYSIGIATSSEVEVIYSIFTHTCISGHLWLWKMAQVYFIDLLLCRLSSSIMTTLSSGSMVALM